MAIVVIGVGVGAIVYALSLWSVSERSPVEEDSGPISPVVARRRRRPRERRVPDAPAVSERTRAPERDAGMPLYVPVLASPGPRWRDRLAGVVGLVAIVVVSAAVLAAVVYQAGHMASEMVERVVGR